MEKASYYSFIEDNILLTSSIVYPVDIEKERSAFARCVPSWHIDGFSTEPHSYLH